MTYLKKAEKQGNVYQNPIPTQQTTESMWKMMWQFATIKGEREPEQPLGPFATDHSIYNTRPAGGLRITWMGHSSLLIEIDGKKILTDPVWGERASFLSFMGPKRFFAPPLPLDKLPELDAIILSHDHYDHLDYPTIKQLIPTTTPIYCSLGVGATITKWGIDKGRITEMDWTDKVMIGNDCSLMAMPARHFSGRGLIRNRALWSSFIIKGHTHNIYFGADSGFFPGFKEIGDTYGPFDLTMLEIGAYGSGWPHIHMGPANASEAHLALKGKVMMPIHWGTFNLALHPWKEPVELILKEAAQKNITLFLPGPGTPTEVKGAHNSKWWER
jgi:L-ascorbate metabolism protein UlaG (beta-lactamase superfamily)